MSIALFLILNVGRVSSCGDIFDEETGVTGASFLSNCTSVAIASANAVVDGSHFPSFDSYPLLGSCVAVSERRVDEAFRNESKCGSCPEACGVVLSLQATAVLFDGIEMCSQTLLPLVRAFQHLDSSDLRWTYDIYHNLPNIVNSRRSQCATERRHELENMPLPSGFGRSTNWVRKSPAPRSGRSERKADVHERHGPKQHASFEQVAVLIAATPSILPVYQPFLNLWRCYALRHGLAFILETDDTEVRPPHQRAPNWLRWLAARRYIQFYKALLVVDPDQFIVPECWNMSIPAILGAWVSSNRTPPDVATRDFGQPQTLNNGVVLLRSSPRGIFFLDQLLAKNSWMQTIEKDQGAFDETVLEILGLEAAARGEEGYDSECSQYVFPNARGNHEIALYALCWWRVSERLAGPFGSRRSSVIRFVDPRIVDVNHVVGARGLDESALLHHFAGRSKNWDAMLEAFGIPRRHTLDCGKVFNFVDAVASQRACVPGGPAIVECEPPTIVC